MENLVSAHYFKSAVSYAPAKLMWGPWNDRNFEIADQTLLLKSKDDGTTSIATIPGLTGDYSTAEALDVRFRYQAKGRAAISMSVYHPEKQLPGYVQKEVAPSEEWTDFYAVLPLNRNGMGGTFTFSVVGKEGFFKVRDLVITEQEAVEENGRKLLLGEKECEAIYYLPDKDKATDYFDRRAAQILRYAFNRAGGKLIPVRPVQNKADYGKCAVYVGQAAEKTGLLQDDELKKIAESGYAMRLAGNRLAIAGKRSGVATGIVAFLKKTGVIYLAQDQYSRPAGDARLTDFTDMLNPAVPIRELSYRVAQPELWGYTSHAEWADLQILASHRGNCHAAIAYVPLLEFENTHPEYFALDANGKRLHSSQGKNVQTHFCMSSKGLQQLLAERVMEMMEADPVAKYFYLFPGDGEGYFCHCKECSKLGGTTDRLLFWINQVAETVARKYPDRRIVTLAYVDSANPPKKVKPAANVIVLYTPYTMAGWGSHMVFDHKANAVGCKQMKDWETLIPGQLGAFTYPNSCTEPLNLWPAFDFNLKLDHHLAAKQYKVVAYCGFIPVFAGGAYPQNGSFTSMQMRVLAEVLKDPVADANRLIDEYMDHAYGPAAHAMRRYFDKITGEPIRLQWEQNTERLARGFVTPSFADSALAELDEAERLAGTDPAYRENVLRELVPMLWSYLSDNCRGNARIGKKEFSIYAARLAKYVAVSKELGYSYLIQPNPKDWFWETAMLKFGDAKPWYDDPVLRDLVKNPEKTLGAVLPVVQEKIEGGYLIANKGIIGGQPMKGTWLRTDGLPVKCFRRPSSGNGIGTGLLRLDKEPVGGGILRIYGIDNEKKKPSILEVLVNGTCIYKGPAPWKKDEWTEQEFSVPANVFHVGDNEISLLNRTEDTEKDGEGGANFAAKRDYNWGWFIVEKIKVILKEP